MAGAAGVEAGAPPAGPVWVPQSAGRSYLQYMHAQVKTSPQHILSLSSGRQARGLKRESDRPYRRDGGRYSACCTYHLQLPMVLHSQKSRVHTTGSWGQGDWPAGTHEVHTRGDACGGTLFEALLGFKSQVPYLASCTGNRPLRPEVATSHSLQHLRRPARPGTGHPTALSIR